MLSEKTRSLKWREVYSLAALNAAVVISWIAYHEYQPVLMEQMNLTHLIDFMIIAKAVILVIIPPFAGWVADRILKKNGKYMIVLTVGIGATAMIFMIVATLLSTDHLMDVSGILPVMIVLWLISMNLFISPANSMIEAFAPAQKLPIVMGFLFLVTEMLYALEPVIVALVSFLGDTLTFIVGGILISGTGYLFYRVSSDEVLQRRKELMEKVKTSTFKQTTYAYFAIVVIGVYLGLGKGFLVEFLPEYLGNLFPEQGKNANLISFGFLGLSAVLGFAISRWVAKLSLSRVILRSFFVLLAGIGLLLISSSFSLTLIAFLIVTISFTLINITGLPFVLRNLDVRHVTYGVGIYIGASELFNGFLEYLYR